MSKIKGFQYFLERLLKGFRSVEKREPNNLEMILIKREAGEKARDANKVIQVDFGEPFGEQIKKGMFDDIFTKMYTDYKGGPKGVMKLVESGDVKIGEAPKTPPYQKSQADIEFEIMEKIKADNEKAIKAFESRNPNKPRDKKYTGGMVDVEPNLSDIGHGSDSLMARTRLISPNNQATTSTGLNYLLAEDNDNIRVPFQDGLNFDKTYEKILEQETKEDTNIIDKGQKELLKKLDSFKPDETEKEKEKREMFNMVKEFQKFKRENPNSRMTMSMFRDIKKKEKELLKNKILDLAVKYPEKKIINEQGFVDKKNLKETIDKAELDLEISPIDGLTLKRSIDTEGDQSVTSGTFDINNFSFSSPSLEEGKLTSSANFNIGDLNLAGTIDSKDSDILKSGIAFNYDDILKGKLSESDGYKEGELNLNKTFPINDKFKLNLKGDSNIMITPDGETYKSSDLIPKLSYNDGILSADISKSILEGSDTPNLSAGVDYNDFYLKGDNLLSDDRSGIVGYQKKFGDKDGDLFFTAGAEKNLFDDGYTGGVGLNYKFADGGRIGFSKGRLADAARRKFMKAAGATGAGIAALKTGLLGFGEKAAPVVEKTVETVQQAPQYFFDLVAKIKMFGKQSKIGPQERVNEFSYTGKNGDEYVLTEDLVTGDAQIRKDKIGGVRISEDEMTDGIADRSVMEYKSGKGMADESTGGTFGDEYDEYRVEFDQDGTEAGADIIDESVQKEIIEEASETITKKAQGGRIGYSKGKAVVSLIELLKDPKKIREAIDNIFKTGDYKMDAEMAAESLVELNPQAFSNKLYDDLDDKTRMQVYSAVIDDVMGDVSKKIKEKKTDTYRFLKKVFGDSLEDMPDRDPELYQGLKEVVPMFRKKDKEGLKMYMQKYLPHMDDTEIEEFIVGEGDISGLSGQLIRLGSGRDYKAKMDMIKEAGEKRKLFDLDITEKMKRQPNASGGLAKMLGE